MIVIKADRVILSSEFVDKYKKNKPDEFKTKLDRVCISYALTRKMQRLKTKKFVKRLIGI